MAKKDSLLSNILVAADLFCGGGGTSTAIVEAGEEMGYQVDLTGVNHWRLAVDTLAKNHPSQNHLCADLDALNPRELFKGRQLKALWASPECTHHSIARGGKPIKDQSRATAWCVTRWAEALNPDFIWVENVKEFETWGPLIEVTRWSGKFKTVLELAPGRKDKWVKVKKPTGKGHYEKVWRPDPARKGEIFQAWVQTLRAIGYTVDWRVLCAADHGDPTTRRRLIIQAVRPPYKIVWPNPTHSNDPSSGLLPWETARSIIDFSVRGNSIYSRKKPLAPKTMRRIMIGLEKYGLQTLIMGQHSGSMPKPAKDSPVPTITTDGNIYYLEPYLVPRDGVHGGNMPRSVDLPLHTVTASHGAGALAQPYLVKLRGTNNAAEIDQPSPTVTGSGGNLAVAQPFLVNMRGQSNAASVDAPAPTVTGSGAGHIGVAQPFLVQTAHSDGVGSPDSRVRSVDEALPTVAGNRGEWAVCNPYIVANFGERPGQEPRTHSVDEPLPTVTSKGAGCLIQPYVITIDQKGGKDTKVSGGSTSVDDPVSTVTSKQRHAIVEPYLVKYYGTAAAESVDEPMDTVTSKPRFGLCQPEIVINGQRYMIDIMFRMLNPKELALAQGFRPDYQFVGNATQVVKQIGNAVPRRMAKAVVRATVSQKA